ncbi:MAG: LysR family transcriptional regulator, partial [Chthoniobacterales bacterium]
MSFTSAAKKLGIAQPPLSTQIKQLETQIGQPLFYRSSRKVTLTEAGLLLSREASAILEQADLLSAKMADLRDGRGTGLSIGITEDLATLALAKILRKFMKKHRGVRCDIRFHRTGPCEFSNGLDVMIVDRSEIGNAAALDLGPAPIYLAVCRKHRLADHESIETNDIIGEHLLQSPPGFLSLAERLIL